MSAGRSLPFTRRIVALALILVSIPAIMGVKTMKLNNGNCIVHLIGMDALFEMR